MSGRTKRQMTWVQKQYQDLENTAKQLQKVGRMWRDKYFSKDGRGRDGLKPGKDLSLPSFG